MAVVGVWALHHCFQQRVPNHDTSRAKKTARSGPTFVPDRGNPAHVFLIRSEDDRKLSGSCLNNRSVTGPAKESRTLSSMRLD